MLHLQNAEGGWTLSQGSPEAKHPAALRTPMWRPAVGFVPSP